MNWKQLYNRATPTEREEIVCLLLQRIHARRTLRSIPVRPIPRLHVPAHYIGMLPTGSLVSKFALSMFVFILATVSAATWTVSGQVNPAFGALMVTSWNAVLSIVLITKPYKTLGIMTRE